MLAVSFSSVFTLWPLQEPPVVIWNLVVEWRGRTKLYEKNVHGSKPTVPLRGDAWRQRPKGQNMPTLMPSEWQSVLSVWQSLKQREMNSSQYRLMMTVYSVLPNRSNCALNDAGELVLTDKDQMKAWVEHYAWLLNVECESPNNKLPGVPTPPPSPNCCPPPSVSATLFTDAIFIVRQLQ